MATGHRDLCSQPAIKREPHQRDCVIQQCIEQRQIEMHEIRDGVERRWPWGTAKTGMRWGDDLSVPTQQSKKASRGIDVLHAVEQEDRLTVSTTDHFECDISH